MMSSFRTKFIGALISLVFAALYTSAAVAQAVQIPPGEQCFQATTGLTGMVGTLGTITAGSGGTNGVYANVALTGGSGTTATANITVSGNKVTNVVILNPGINYAVNDTLSAASGSIGGVSGFSVPIASISINSSLAGGFVGMYVPGTLTASNTWQNASQSILNQNPIGLDSNGCALIYGVGTYRQILYDNLGNVVWDKTTSVQPVASFAGTSTGTANVQAVTAGNFNFGNGQQIIYKANLANTNSVTLSPNGGAATQIFKDTPAPSALVGGEISLGAMVTVTYDSVGGVFHLMSVDNAILTNANNAFTGNNTFAGTSTFNGAVINNSTVANNGAVTNSVAVINNGSTAYLEQTLVVTTGTAAWNMAVGPNALLNLTVATTLANPTNQAIGQAGILRLLQDGTGGRTFAIGSSYKLVSDSFSFLANAETEYFYKVVAASGANSIELRAKTRAFIGPITITTTSGTTADFTGANAIPSWVKRITVTFAGVSTNGTSLTQMQIGPSATPDTTSYTSLADRPSSSTVTSTTGFVTSTAATASHVRNGSMTFINSSGFRWDETGLNEDVTSTIQSVQVGTHTSASAINILRMTTVNGTDAFNAGSVSAIYE